MAVIFELMAGLIELAMSFFVFMLDMMLGSPQCHCQAKSQLPICKTILFCEQKILLI